MFRNLTVALLLLALFSCTRQGSSEGPQGVLTDYINRSFAAKSEGDKDKLLELATGEVKEALEKLDTEAFRKYFVDSKREFVSLKIKDERALSTEKYSITYELAYISVGQESKGRVTNKKAATLVMDSGKWKIAEVRTLKTYIENQNELSF